MKDKFEFSRNPKVQINVWSTSNISGSSWTLNLVLVKNFKHISIKIPNFTLFQSQSFSQNPKNNFILFHFHSVPLNISIDRNATLPKLFKMHIRSLDIISNDQGWVRVRDLLWIASITYFLLHFLSERHVSILEFRDDSYKITRRFHTILELL